MPTAFIMKNFFVLLVLAIFILTASAQNVKNMRSGMEEINATVDFTTAPTVSSDGKYYSVHFADLPTLTSPGQPALPFYPCRILLPPNREIKEVTVTGKKESLKGTFRIIPAPIPVPWFLEGSRGKLATEHAVYSQSESFPGYLHSSWILTVLAGYPIASFNIYPVQYNPSTGEISYYSSVDVRITLMAVRAGVQIRSDYESRVRSLVCNPDVAGQYNDREFIISARQNTPYVIITAKSLLNASGQYNFEYFANFLISKGVNATIVTVEDIYQNYTGKDQADKVRNFIKYAFKNWNTKYVLLAGDADKGSELVPVRRFKTDIYYVYADGTSLTVHEQMAADYYYSALDGDFDGNQNGSYGEPDDNNDLEPEVAVGRAPVDNATQINNFVRKTVLAYKHAEEVETPKVLLLGEHLFSPGQCGMTKDIYGDDFMDEIFKGANTHGFYTHGFTSKWAMAKLYDREQSWGSTQIKDQLNNSGACWINHIGHSSPSYNMRLYRSSISSLTNSVPFLYYSQGCNAARFTNEATAPYGRNKDEERADDSIAEYLVHSTCGAFAVIANWSYGLSPEDPQTSQVNTPGSSQYFHRFLAESFFNPSINLSRIGDMLAYSKTAMNPWLLDTNMQTQTVRWVYYELNLLGDPYAPLPKK